MVKQISNDKKNDSVSWINILQKYCLKKNIQENIYGSFYILLYVFETVWYLIYSAVPKYL